MPGRASPRQNASPLVALDGVTVTRDRRELLSDVSWRLMPGEVWAIAGPNGAGKSTLLRVLRDEIPISAGDVAYSFPRAGRRARRDAPEPRVEIRVVSFQAQVRILSGAAGYAQSRWHACEDDDAATGKDLLGEARRTKRGRRLFDALGLARLLDRRVTELSNGERRKLLLVREAARNPGVLALDNPFSGIDRSSRVTLARAIRRLRREGVALILVTARKEEIPESATHVLVLVGGRVVASGPRARVLRSRAFRDAMRASAREATRKPRRTDSDGRPVFELRSTSLRYDATRVLANVTWRVRRGERWIVLGRNGAGKSALLSLVLADNPQAYANDIVLFGRPRGTGETIWEIRRRIGCVSPELHLFHGAASRALDVVSSGMHDSIGLYHKPSARESRAARRWLRELGLGALGDRAFGELSEGEQQLILLARALVKEPELLVLDEPCQGLDDSNRRRVLDCLETVMAETDVTLIFVTHDLNELPAGVTHGLILRDGRVRFEGSARSAMSRYRRARC